MSQERQTFLLGNSDRLRSPYLQNCAPHSSVNFIPVFWTKRAVSILVQGKCRRTRTTYNSSVTQLYTIKFLLLPFQLKEARFWYLQAPPFYLRHFISIAKNTQTPFTWPLSNQVEPHFTPSRCGMLIFKLGRTRFAQPQLRRWFDPVTTGFEVLEKWQNVARPSQMQRQRSSSKRGARELFRAIC